VKILLAVDGSPISMRAVKEAVKLIRQLSEPAELVLFYADTPLPQAAAVKLGADAVKLYHEENGDYATKAARAALNRAKVPYARVLAVGEPAESIVKHAQKGRFDLIVMGSHGRGALQGLLLGSVARKVMALGDTPVLVVR
jgi:nucleotide-binding universal stress UspA family protein